MRSLTTVTRVILKDALFKSDNFYFVNRQRYSNM